MLKRCLLKLLQWDIQRIVQKETEPLERQLQNITQRLEEQERNSNQMLTEMLKHLAVKSGQSEQPPPHNKV